MSITIKPDQIQVGDKIRITKEFFVMEALDRDGYVRAESGRYISAEVDTSAIELLERKSEPLPTEKGTLIRVFSDAGEGRWMLTDPAFGAHLIWVSESGNRRTSQELSLVIAERPDRSFEVIA